VTKYDLYIEQWFFLSERKCFQFLDTKISLLGKQFKLSENQKRFPGVHILYIHILYRICRHTVQKVAFREWFKAESQQVPWCLVPTPPPLLSRSDSSTYMQFDPRMFRYCVSFRKTTTNTWTTPSCRAETLPKSSKDCIHRCTAWAADAVMVLHSLLQIGCLVS
jgi:hypothetical protein